MKKNIGSIDKMLRFALAVVFVVLYFMGITQGLLGIVLLVFGFVFALTGLIGFCPLYMPLKINTNKDSDPD